MLSSIAFGLESFCECPFRLAFVFIGECSTLICLVCPATETDGLGGVRLFAGTLPADFLFFCFCARLTSTECRSGFRIY